MQLMMQAINESQIDENTAAPMVEFLGEVATFLINDLQ